MASPSRPGLFSNMATPTPIAAILAKKRCAQFDCFLVAFVHLQLSQFQNSHNFRSNPAHEIRGPYGKKNLFTCSLIFAERKFQGLVQTAVHPCGFFVTTARRLRLLPLTGSNRSLSNFCGVPLHAGPATLRWKQYYGKRHN